ncbi:hypothetical protein JXA80_05525 [bacterium]|nr:hypothetical protein [candidate division CSSED10-310 bacterium]
MKKQFMRSVIGVIGVIGWWAGMMEPAFSQVKREPEGAPLPAYAQVFTVSPDRSVADFYPPARDDLPIIMLTGYWPPTNEMIRLFSANPDHNPLGWIGDNWEGRGYNIYAFFPEFPGGMGQGVGDFEVDYQDTSADWWYYVAELNPIAIICFGRAFNNTAWELEPGARNHDMNEWSDDYTAPFKPTIDLPIVAEPVGFDRYSTLPIPAIIDALGNAGVPVNAFSSTIDTSAFLCNFIGYHVSWYHDLHADPEDPAWNIAGGHIHVGYANSLETAIWATEVTVRTLIEHLDAERCANHGDVNWDGVLTATDAQSAFLIALGSMIPTGVEACAADCNGDGSVTAADAQSIFLGALGQPQCVDPL